METRSLPLDGGVQVGVAKVQWINEGLQGSLTGNSPVIGTERFECPHNSSMRSVR
jgi:hypothetical protein